MTKETVEAEKLAFVSEHRTFAEAEGYDVMWSDADRGWIVISPRKLRLGEKVQVFRNLNMAWEVAAIRAGRKITPANGPWQTVKARPKMEHVKQPPKVHAYHRAKDVFE